MTLEEKAEKYARKTKKVDWEGFDVDKEARKEGDIAGVTENGVVWHDLRKNPDDLPPMYDLSASLSKNVLLDAGVIGYYSYNQKRWCASMGHRIIKDVIAWGEIPKFWGGRT